LKKFMITPEEGAQSSLRCATAPELANETGKYYDVGGKEKRPNRVAEDAELARTLWTKSGGINRPRCVIRVAAGARVPLA